MTDHGMVHSFDGITQVVPPEFLSVLASSNLDPSDPCNFEARIKTEVHVCHFKQQTFIFKVSVFYLLSFINIFSGLDQVH